LSRVVRRTLFLAVAKTQAMPTTTLAVLVVVPHEGRYLIVEERDGTFYLPAGRVEPGENLMAAAVRETAEEAGIMVGLRGLFGVDHSATAEHLKLRFIFAGYPALLSAPKQVADHHSRGARWANLEEIDRLPLRHPEVVTWIERYEGGAALLPCSAYTCFVPGPAPRWSAKLTPT
jgi:phosphatase NudJ